MGLNFIDGNKGTVRQFPSFIQSTSRTTLTPVNTAFLQSLGFIVKDKKKQNGTTRHIRGLKV